MTGKFQTNLTIIADEARHKIDENLTFRLHLKTYDRARLNSLFEELHNEIAPRIDCVSCGNCCRHLQAPVLTYEIPTLASATGHSPESFKKLFLAKTPAHWFINHEPCAFLDGTRCAVYASRPGSCHSYPHLVEPDIHDRLYAVLDNYAICPIVFNVVEELKIRLEFITHAWYEPLH